MANFYKDNDDLRFYVDQAIDWKTLVDLVEHDLKAPDAPATHAEAVQSYRDILEMWGKFVAEEVAPRSPRIDAEPVRVEDGKVHTGDAFNEIFTQIRELGMHGLAMPRELGGMNCPIMMYFLACEILARADVATMTHHGFHGGIAVALLLYSIVEGTTEFDRETSRITKTRFETAIQELVAGTAWGAMDITEPNAGSDMAAIATRGELGDDGQWTLSGEKIFITSGHGKYHLVVARTEAVPADADRDAFAGLKGLSLFLAQTYEDGPDGTRRQLATVERVEEKIGHHGSPTCTVRFDQTPALLIGKRGDGFKHMLLLMNNARLGVGFESLGLCEAAYRMARDYAAERKTMGKTIDRHEIIADYLDEMKTDLQAIRALAMEAAAAEETSQRLNMRTLFWQDDDSLARRRAREQRKRTAQYARRLTPLLKMRAAEKAVELSRRCMQILGGVGYTREYGAEKLLRDALVLPIYEGTTQIQALMATKDALTAALRSPQELIKTMAQARWKSITARDPLERRVAKLQTLAFGAQQHLISKTAARKIRAVTHKPVGQWRHEILKNWDPRQDFSYAMLHAERFANLLADVSIAEILHAQARRFPARRELLERFLERAEARCRLYHGEIIETGERILATLQPSVDENLGEPSRRSA